MFSLTLVEPVEPSVEAFAVPAQRFQRGGGGAEPHLVFTLSGVTPAISQEQDGWVFKFEIVDSFGVPVVLPDDLESHHQYLYGADGKNYRDQIKVRLKNVTFKVWFPTGFVLVPGLYAVRIYVGSNLPASTVLDLR